MRARLWVQRMRTLRDYAALCQDQEAPFGIKCERVTEDRGVGVFATRAGDGCETGAVVMPGRIADGKGQVAEIEKGEKRRKKRRVATGHESTRESKER